VGEASATGPAACGPGRLVLALRGFLEAADQEHRAVPVVEILDVEVERGVRPVDDGDQGSSK
jgi:hypothetical protein